MRVVHVEAGDTGRDQTIQEFIEILKSFVFLHIFLAEELHNQICILKCIFGCSVEIRLEGAVVN